jgi:hypothetical protein
MDPVTGVVEPYSNEIQRILNMKSVPSETFLGSKCFNATVHLQEDGAHYQTTPAIRSGRGYAKPHGYRQVRKITNNLPSTLYKTHTRHGWRFSSSSGEHVLINYPKNQVAVWQWCTEPSFTPDADKWVCYETNVNDALEIAWRNEGNDNFELVIQVGISNKRIIINRNNAFFRQHDTEIHTNQRWVRRIFMELSEVQSIRDSSSHNCPDDVCAICLCSYTETAMTPRKTLPCNHIFHHACLAPIIQKHCPLCRAPFS